MNTASSPLSRRIAAGSFIWIMSIHYFVIEFIAQRAWGPVPYTLRFNTISDLGATLCGTIPMIGTYACSPLHLLMNLAFVLSGALAIIGAYLVRPAFPKHWTVSLALLLIVLGSIGTIGVGLFPENEQLVMHLISALTLFVLGNTGLLVLGISLYRLNWRRTYAAATALLGAIGLLALILIPATFTPLGGIGVVERIVAYPLTLWIIASGILFLKQSLRTKK